MTRTLSFVLALLAPSLASAKLEVVATVPDLGAVAREVGGELVTVTSLAAPGQDAHYVDPRPSYVVTLNRADALLMVGLDLEVGWLPKLQVQARNPRIAPGGAGLVDASQLVSPLEVPVGPVDRRMGDIHPGGNPHYTFDPRAMAQVARGLGERFAALDPANAAAYRSGAMRTAARLQELAATQAKRFRALPPEKRQLVCYHQSLPYLLDWLGLRLVGTIEPKPGVSPTPSHVAEVLSAMRATGTKLVLQEDHHPTSTSAKLAQLATAKLLLVRSGADVEAGETYERHIMHVAEELYAALTQ